MSHTIYPIRLSRQDRRLFRQAARAESKSIAEWLREAGRQRAKQAAHRRAACLDYPEWRLSEKAERDKDYLKKKFKGKV